MTAPYLKNFRIYPIDGQRFLLSAFMFGFNVFISIFLKIKTADLVKKKNLVQGIHIILEKLSESLVTSYLA